MVYLLTILLAFCSVVYELLLGQTLSAFLGNTVLRFSVTIGLYMLSMGIGALLVRGTLLQRPVVWLQRVEICLAIIGGFSLGFLFLINWLGFPEFLFSLSAHTSIVVIGILTGAEIPLLIKIRNLKKPDSEATVLGLDYIGAFIGSILFAFYFYPQLGLIPSTLTIALINSIAGLFLISQRHHVNTEDKRHFGHLLWVQSALCLLLVNCVQNSDSLTNYYLHLYLQ